MTTDIILKILYLLGTNTNDIKFLIFTTTYLIIVDLKNLI